GQQPEPARNFPARCAKCSTNAKTLSVGIRGLRPWKPHALSHPAANRIQRLPRTCPIPRSRHTRFDLAFSADSYITFSAQEPRLSAGFFTPIFLDSTSASQYVAPQLLS